MLPIYLLSLSLKPSFLRLYKTSATLPEIRFSTCGTYAIIQHIESWSEIRSSVVHQLNSHLVRRRIIDNSIFGEELATREYGIQLVRNGSNVIDLKMTRPFQRSSWRHVPDPARLKDFVLHPSHLRHTRQYLLLGDDDNTKMRMLFVPEDGTAPEVMPLLLTFAEALARLTIEWERITEV